MFTPANLPPLPSHLNLRFPRMPAPLAFALLETSRVVVVVLFVVVLLLFLFVVIVPLLVHFLLPPRLLYSAFCCCRVVAVAVVTGAGGDDDGARGLPRVPYLIPQLRKFSSKHRVNSRCRELDFTQLCNAPGKTPI